MFRRKLQYKYSTYLVVLFADVPCYNLTDIVITLNVYASETPVDHDSTRTE